MPKIRTPVIFFGWWINIFTAIICGIASAYYQLGGSVLFKPIASDLGMDRATTSIASSLGLFLNGLTFALAGWLSDRFGPKHVTIAGASILSIGIILMNFVNSPIMYIIVWGILIIPGATLGLSVSIDTVLTNWFIKKRGLAFSVRFGIAGLMGVALAPVLSWNIETLGWRFTSLIWGIIFCVLSIPILLYFIRPKRPEYYGMLPDGAKLLDKNFSQSVEGMVSKGQEYAAAVEETEFTFKEALRTSSFWMINIGWLAHTMVLPAFNLHVVPFLTDRGIEPIAAAGLLSFMWLFSLPSRLLGGIMTDRIKKSHIRFLVAGALFLPALGIALFLVYPHMVSVYFMLALYGMGLGAYTITDILLRSRYFGRKAYGSIQGISNLMSAPVAFAFPILAGWIFDTTGVYDIAFIIFTIIAFVGGTALCFARVPVKPLTK